MCHPIAFLLSVFFITGLCGCAHVPPDFDEVSIRALQRADRQAKLTWVTDLAPSETVHSSLMSYESDGLRQYTLVSKPLTRASEHGYPVIIFAHGFHPQPKKYGVSTITGKDWRPGDYYREIPEQYVANGFLVLTPDYRGHNQSQGFDYTQRSHLATSYYASDVLNLLAALSSLTDIDHRQIYFVGHSMGGEVGLKLLLATDQIRAASLWAPVTASTEQQALYYGHYFDEKKSAISPQRMTHYLAKIRQVYAALPTAVAFSRVDPIYHLEYLQTPVIIHHARSDVSVPYSWSEDLVIKLHEGGKKFEMYAYDSSEHLFEGEHLEQVVRRDIQFFKAN